MKRVLSLFIILVMTLSILSSCSLLPEELKFCNVNFYIDGELYDTKTVAIGNPVNEPSHPDKENEIFVSWQTRGLLIRDFDFTKKVTGDLDLHAYYVIDAVAMNEMIMKKTINSIVTIENKSYNTSMGSLIETDFDLSQGSGVVIDISGGYCYVLTNYHVVEKTEGFAKQKFSIEDPWGNIYEAQIYKNAYKSKAAMSSDYDLALLCFKYVPSVGSSLEEIGVGENPKVNQYVAALGTPEGLQNAVTYGNVLVYEMIDAGENSNLQNINFEVVIHDAFINHGSSGGALINTSGELVGINFAGYGDGDYGCAIPIEKVNEFLSIYVY
jgi:hypothetical protein